MEAAAADSSPFDALPDGVLSLVLETLGVQGAACARAVCQRWREAAEALVWSRVDLVAKSAERVAQLASVLVTHQRDADSHRARGRRWIRVAPGASLSLEMPSDPAADHDGDTSDDGLWRAVLSLASACTCAAAMASSGRGGLGLVDIMITARPAAGSRCCAIASELLAALAPRDGMPAAAAKGIALHQPYATECLGPPRKLDSLLRPFPNLERLQLPCVLDTAAAAAIARALPRLKHLHQCVRSYQSVEPLAALASLEVLAIEVSSDRDIVVGLDPAPLLEALASGPAGLSLRELCCTHLTCGALRVLPRFPALEQLHAGHIMTAVPVGVEDLLALGACPSLRSAKDFFLVRDEAEPNASLAARLAALATVMEQRPLLQLDLRVDAEALRVEEVDALATLARAAGSRLDLHLTSHLSPDAAIAAPADVAAALAGSPPDRLSLSIFRGGGPALDDAAVLDSLRQLSVFAACFHKSIEVDIIMFLDVDNDGEFEGGAKDFAGAVLETIKSALPTATCSIV
eukprot:tig00000361_g24406.t1